MNFNKKDLDGLKGQLATYLEKITKKMSTGYKCPACQGAKPIRCKPGDTKAECPACGWGGSILDIWAEQNQKSVKTDFRAVVIGAAKAVGFTFDQMPEGLQVQSRNLDQLTASEKTELEQQSQRKGAALARYWQDLPKWQAATQVAEKWAARGFTADFVKEHGLGYDAKENALVIPFYEFGSSTYFRKRQLDAQAQAKYKYLAPKAADFGEQPLYRWIDAINRAKEQAASGKNSLIYVTEGEIDTLSILASARSLEGLNIDSVAYVGAGNAQGGARKIREQIALLTADEKKRVAFILVPDNDETGNGAQSSLEAVFRAFGCRCYAPELIKQAGGKPVKDANDLLRYGENNELPAWLEVTATEARLELEQEQNQAALEWEKGFSSNLAAFEAEIENRPEPIPTGFKNLDQIINGGLVNNLYILGAETSLGKSTFALQLADQVASSGQDVLYYALEQSRAELISKSLSRYTYSITQENGLDGANALNNFKILNFKHEKEKGHLFGQQEQIYNQAKELYRLGPGKHIMIKEVQSDLKVSDIVKEVQRFKLYRGTTPVVIVDYLQILAPENPKDSEKEIIDHNITALKHLANGTPGAPGPAVLAIASYNRAAKSEGANMSAFNGSGNIEYRADVIFMMQPAGMTDYPKNDAERAENKRLMKDAKKKLDINIELVVTKQRGGRTYQAAKLGYSKVFNTFVEGGTTEGEPDTDETGPSW